MNKPNPMKPNDYAAEVYVTPNDLSTCQLINFIDAPRIHHALTTMHHRAPGMHHTLTTYAPVHTPRINHHAPKMNHEKLKTLACIGFHQISISHY